MTEHHLEFLSLKGGCTGSTESSLVKMPICSESRVTAQIMNSAISEHLDQPEHNASRIRVLLSP